MRAALILALACGCAAPRPAPTDARAGLEALVRTRCATDGAEVITTWRGHVFARVPDAPARQVFEIVGMNVARCLRDAPSGFAMTSRELMMYLDPATHRPLERWRNPWTGRDVTVVPVANSPVQARLRRAPPPRIASGRVSFQIDVPVHAAGYDAIELFVLSSPAREALDPSRTAVSEMTLTWHRVGPWLPWMDMGDRPGELVYSAVGERVRSFEALPEPLREVIETRLPAFRSAPRCWLEAPNETSWTYFARHRAAWERGERFPAPHAGDARCAP